MKICFVCTGNIFRSMSAEYCLKKFLEEKSVKGIIVSSAGTWDGEIYEFEPGVLETLDSSGINPKAHKQRRINQNIIDENDLVVAMSTNHKAFIKENFNIDIPMFKEICYKDTSPLLDNNEAIENWDWNSDESKAYNIKMVKYIHKSIPFFVANYKEYI
ncbi:hypothetical protein H8D36_04510 [archaeon]|nr:hypothetical protein [archaeon]MBL7057243.1 hypothetical protein [Candidatus Woesearchaeota archaeon]